MAFSADRFGADYKGGLFIPREQPQDLFPDDLDLWSFLCSFKSPRRAPPRRDWTWFLEVDGTETTFGQVYDRVEGLARALTAELQLRQDDVIGIFSPNCVDWPIACWAAFRSGCIVSPANPSYTADELAHQLSLVAKHHPIKALFVHPSSLNAGLKAAANINLSVGHVFLLQTDGQDSKGALSIDDLLQSHVRAPAVPEQRWKQGDGKRRLALVTASSGTTGLPKIIAIPHCSAISNVLQHTQHHRGFFRPRQDRVLGVLPFYHIYGFVIGLTCTVYDSMPLGVITRFRFEPVLDAIAKLRLTILYIVPPLVTLMVKNPAADKYDLSHCRYMMVGAAPLGQDVFKAFTRKYPNMICGQAYGMSETSTIVFAPAWSRRGEIELASCGVMVNGVVCKIVDPATGKNLGYHQRGELCIKSPANALGYLGNEQATLDTFRDGFVHSGDEAYVDENGNFYITDRLKELIKHKGLQVAPAELEDHILSHPDVVDVAVIGVPCPYAGELPRAYCVLAAEASRRCSSDRAQNEVLKDGIIQHVARVKAPSKHLTGGVVFIDAIPKKEALAEDPAGSS